MSTITLRSASTRVELLPESGGVIARYCTEHQGRTIDWLRAGDAERPAAFPMVPFCSRIKDARFRFAQRSVQLVANFPPEPHAIHGQGWQNPWRVTEQRDDLATLEYAHQADDWPWDYLACQQVALHADRLSVALSVRNCSAAPMPAGLGLHPFFSRTPGARIQAVVGEVWEMDAQIMPVQRVPLPADLDLAHGISADARVLDNVFANWDGRFSVDWPEWGARLAVRATPTFSHLVVYTPAGEAFFCMEPASNVTDAFNLLWRGESGHGAAILAPDEVLAGTVEFAPLIIHHL